MPLRDVQCYNCSTERELLIHGHIHLDHTVSAGLGSTGDRRAFWLKCDSEHCKGKMRRHYVVERFYAPAIRFKDGVSQWESNEKRARALREGKH